MTEEERVKADIVKHFEKEEAWNNIVFHGNSKVEILPLKDRLDRIKIKAGKRREAIANQQKKRKTAHFRTFNKP